jgi:CBS-domain-containing membrane protein
MRDSVKNNCSPGLLTIHYLDSLEQAHDKMQKFSIRHLPVIDDKGIIVGIFSDKDVRKSAWETSEKSLHLENHSSDFAKCQVYKFMNWPVNSIDAHATTMEATRMMVDHKISCLVITDGQMAIGLITTEDLLRNLLHIQEHNTFEVNALTLKYYSSPIKNIVDSLASIGI